jgi:hypothetical protein
MAARVKISTKVDAKELLKSLKAEAKKFGESTREATARMALQTARELSKSTQAFGASWKKTQDIQRGAIIADMAKIFIQSQPGRGVVDDAGEALKILDKNRKGKGMRTAEIRRKTRVTEGAFTGAMMAKMRRAGMGKAAWVGSARHLERKQGKGSPIRFGKAYSAALRKWEALGNGTRPTGDFKPSVELRNTVRHTGEQHVLSRQKIASAQQWAVRNTLKWYMRAATANLAKNKP